jgi:hypothetical protein
MSILVASGLISIIWSIVRNDVSGGFSIGAYLVAAASAVLAFIFYWWTSPH